MKHRIRTDLILDAKDVATSDAIRKYLAALGKHFLRLDKTETSFIEYHPCYHDEKKQCNPKDTVRWEANGIQPTVTEG